MKTTKNLGLNMPDANDFVEIDKINKNTEKIDEELAKKADASGGDISETVITSTETSQAEYPVPAAGDSAKTVLGKVQKFFADIRNWMTGVCLLGQIVNNCVTDNAKLPLSAAQGKVLMDLYNVLNTNTSKADHTHDNRYYQLTAISVQDCLQDTCAPGAYIFDRTALNKPTSDTTLGGIVLTIGYSAIYCCRLAITTDGCFYTSVFAYV